MGITDDKSEQNGQRALLAKGRCASRTNSGVISLDVGSFPQNPNPNKWILCAGHLLSTASSVLSPARGGGRGVDVYDSQAGA